jgi:uncharacterized protein YecE (DUF72 family)
MLFDRRTARERLDAWATRHGVLIGTSSWKFADWCGLLYDEERYLYRRRFSQARFERECLAEYAGVFPTVGVDATWYRYPKRSYIDSLMASAPPGFRFSFKVPDDLTLKNFPNVPAFGHRAGLPNPDFLSVPMCRYGFLRMLEPFRDRVGAVIFEFSHFHPDEFRSGREFADLLDAFLAEMPGGWDFAVEVRNRNLLHPDYLAMLRRHGVAHVYNHWTHMPPVPEQLALFPPDTQPFLAARFLLPPERPLAWVRQHFTPYSRIHEIDPAAREGALALLRHAKLHGAADRARRPSYLYFGNDLEGCALHTIADLLESEAP